MVQPIETREAAITATTTTLLQDVIDAMVLDTASEIVQHQN